MHKIKSELEGLLTVNRALLTSQVARHAAPIQHAHREVHLPCRTVTGMAYALQERCRQDRDRLRGEARGS